MKFAKILKIWTTFFFRFLFVKQFRSEIPPRTSLGVSSSEFEKVHENVIQDFLFSQIFMCTGEWVQTKRGGGTLTLGVNPLCGGGGHTSYFFGDPLLNPDKLLYVFFITNIQKSYNP